MTLGHHGLHAGTVVALVGGTLYPLKVRYHTFGLVSLPFK